MSSKRMESLGDSYVFREIESLRKQSLLFPSRTQTHLSSYLSMRISLFDGSSFSPSASASRVKEERECRRKDDAKGKRRKGLRRRRRRRCRHKSFTKLPSLFPSFSYSSSRSHFPLPSPALFERGWRGDRGGGGEQVQLKYPFLSSRRERKGGKKMRAMKKEPSSPFPFVRSNSIRLLPALDFLFEK